MRKKYSTPYGIEKKVYDFLHKYLPCLLPQCRRLEDNEKTIIFRHSMGIGGEALERMNPIFGEVGNRFHIGYENGYLLIYWTLTKGELIYD